MFRTECSLNFHLKGSRLCSHILWHADRKPSSTQTPQQQLQTGPPSSFPATPVSALPAGNLRLRPAES